MRRLVAIILACLLGGLSANDPALAQAAKQPARTLRAAYLTSLSFSPLFLALEKGYCHAENVNVDIQIVQSAADATAVLGLGQMDIAFGPRSQCDHRAFRGRRDAQDREAVYSGAR